MPRLGQLLLFNCFINVSKFIPCAVTILFAEFYFVGFSCPFQLHIFLICMLHVFLLGIGCIGAKEWWYCTAACRKAFPHKGWTSSFTIYKSYKFRNKRDPVDVLFFSNFLVKHYLFVKEGMCFSISYLVNSVVNMNL
jgi:hypothetical protein